MTRRIARFVLPAIYFMVAACAPSSPGATTSAPDQRTAPANPKRITIMLKTEPTQLTPDDLFFTLDVKRDKELPFASNALFEFVEAATAPDPRSITVSWKSPYIHADALFSQTIGLPLPRHLLEEPYRAGDKNAFMAL